MCHYLGGGLHGRQKRVKAQSESSKSVVNSVLISREMPVFLGFLEIIRVVHKNNSIELYFEEKDIEAFVEKLEKLYPKVEYVNHLMTYSWGQKVVRFYDLDGNLIEVRTPL